MYADNEEGFWAWQCGLEIRDHMLALGMGDEADREPRDEMWRDMIRTKDGFRDRDLSLSRFGE